MMGVIQVKLARGFVNVVKYVEVKPVLQMESRRLSECGA